MQAGIQKYVDHSISNTLNLPAKTSANEVEELLILAWELGLKGISVYRDGSRSGILLKSTGDAQRFSTYNATKRPKTLTAELHMPTIGGQQWIVLVGILDSKPYEVFAFKDGGEVDWKTFSSMSNPRLSLLRVKSGHYRLSSDHTGVIVDNIVDKFETPNEEFITRLVSTSLRHGTHVRFVVEQMTTAKGAITDFHKVISRVLRKYIHDSEVSTDKCPVCSNTLQFIGGCLQCTCGYSKC
jgi:ribonucleoside-diphosphate reductase alpha chain